MLAKVKNVARQVKLRLPRPSLPNYTFPAKVDSHVIKFFDTFGFVKLTGFFKDELDWISRDFDKLMQSRFGKMKGHPYLYPQFIDNSPTLFKLIELPKVVELASAICGKNYIYKGSDGALFPGGSPWHRDYLIRLKSCKVLTYLENNQSKSGAFCTLPGSQFIDDAYSSFLSAALTWPEPPSAGGFDEKSFFGQGHDPRLVGRNRVIPYVQITTSPGDIIVFNHNLIHCVNQPFWPKRRRLLGLHFCANALADSPNDPLAAEAMENMRNIALVEMASFKLKNFYGPYVHNATSEVVRRQTSFLRDLSVKIEGEFDGFYSKQTKESVDVCNGLKNDSWQRKRLLN